MQSRPSVPRDIARAVLVEAGHRCAVCGVPCPLERAHVVPWRRSKSHKQEDLICLCSNCHQRADYEKWGEKTLREYKQNPWILRQNASHVQIPERTTPSYIKVQMSAENGPGKALVRVDNTGETAIFRAYARVMDVKEQVENPKFLHTYGLSWSSSGKDEMTVESGAASSLIIASTGETITRPYGRDICELLLTGYVDGKPSTIDQFRWHAGDPPGAVAVYLEVSISSPVAAGVITRQFVVTSREWGGVRIEAALPTSE